MKRIYLRVISMLSALLIMIGFVGFTPNNKAKAASNEEIIYSFMKSELGFNTAVASAALANIYSESGFNPASYGIDTDGYPSFGICQWHLGRYDRLQNYCNDNGYNYKSLDGQLRYLKYEFETSYSSQYYQLKSYPNTEQGAYDASYYWASKFEVCASKYWNGRGNLAKNTYYPKYNDQPDPISTVLNVIPGFSVSDTYFSWNNVQNADHYDLKIWKGEHWVGDAYHVEWGLKDTSCNIKLPSGDYEAYVDTTVGDNFQMSNVVAFSVKDGTILSVNSSYSSNKTNFSWIAVPGADHYDVKIWNGTYWVGDSYHTEWGVKETSCNISLPAGYYEAYVDTTVGDNYQMSNVVSFTIVDGTPLTYELGNSSSETIFRWNKVNNAESYDLKIWNGTCWVGDAYHIQWGVKDTSFAVKLPVGYYEAYVDTTINGEYATMSNIVSFEVKNGTKLSVDAGTSKKDTVFKWTEVAGAKNYDLKIWNGTYWVGDAYHIEWGVENNSVSMKLPAGYYEAYVDTHVDNNYMSNVVKFTVDEAKEIEGDCNDDGEFNISDVVLLQKWLLAVPNTHMENWKAANLCKDDRLDVFDLCLMKRKLIYK